MVLHLCHECGTRFGITPPREETVCPRCGTEPVDSFWSGPDEGQPIFGSDHDPQPFLAVIRPSLN